MESNSLVDSLHRKMKTDKGRIAENALPKTRKRVIELLLATTKPIRSNVEITLLNVDAIAAVASLIDVQVIHSLQKSALMTNR